MGHPSHDYEGDKAISHDVQRGHAPDAGAALRETALAGARARLRLCPPGYLRSHPNLALPNVSDDAVPRARARGRGAPLRGLGGAGTPPTTVVRAAKSLIDFVHRFALGEASNLSGSSTSARGC